MSGIKRGRSEPIGVDVAVAVARPRTSAQTLRLAHPLVRTTSAFELTAVGALLLSALGLWLLVIPLELLRFAA